MQDGQGRIPSVLPAPYHYLNDEKSPRVLNEMLQLYGTHEGVGDADNPQILAWAQELGSKVGMVYNHDSLAWCGLTMGLAVKRAGYVPPDICVRASVWDTFGMPVDFPMLGDILRFERPGGGHVGLYVGEDAETYRVLAGNQGDAVSIASISKARLVGARRCPYQVMTANIRRIYLDVGATISHDEA